MGTTAVIMAGGKGTRIASVRADLPKPMLEICGEPVLARQLHCLRENGIVDVVLVVGHMGQTIQDYFRDGSAYGVQIRYIQEDSPLGTAGALFFLKDLTEDFFLLNGDIIFDVDFKQMLAYHRDRDAEITLFAHPNSHPHDSTLLVCDAQDRVTGLCREGREQVRNCVNAGIHILSPTVLHGLDTLVPRSLDRDIIAPRLQRGRVFAYHSAEYVHDMGTPERYQQVCADVETGLVARRNKKHPQRAFFLDRDGTLNTYCGYITAPDQMILMPGVAQAVRRINQSGFLAIVVTNQPVIARGDCSLERLEEIHGRLDYLLGLEGAYLDGLYFCPHHPDRGFPGEVPEYKCDCGCRKPKPGLLLRAGEEFHINLSASFMIGDDERDVQAGQAAGCTAVRIMGDCSGSTQADYSFPSLQDAVKKLIPTGGMQ